MFNRLAAFPESRRILILHLLSTPFSAVYFGVIEIMPVMLLKDFNAASWHIPIATSALSAMFLLSICWNEIYLRSNVRIYLLLVYLLAYLPVAGIALCHRPEWVLAIVLLSSMGLAGFNSLNGDMLRHCYAEPIRSEVWGLLNAVWQGAIMVLAYAVGKWLDADGQAFRIYMPVSAVLLAIGVWLLARITYEPLFAERARARPTQPVGEALRSAYANMTKTLREDPVFRRYETAFGIYGMGWMTCAALLPFLAVDILNMSYTGFARSTQVAFKLTFILMIIPAGSLIHRFGPIRVAGRCFALMSLWPVGMTLVSLLPAGLLQSRVELGLGRPLVSELSLAVVMVASAVATSGIHLAWTLGPVALARDPAHAASYLAIHATLVGVRSVVAQFPAVLLYRLTGQIWLPLSLAIVLFLTGAWLMRRLERAPQAPTEPAVPEVMPPDPAEVA